MSSITAGASSSSYDNLSALLEFVKSPDYLERVKELRDLEDSSRKAHDEAQASIADAATKTHDLAVAQAKYNSDVAQLASDRAAHDKKVALWNKSMDAMGKAMRGEE